MISEVLISGVRYFALRGAISAGVGGFGDGAGAPDTESLASLVNSSQEIVVDFFFNVVVTNTVADSCFGVEMPVYVK